MVKQYICLVLLVVFISIAGSRKCDLKTESGEVIKVCCADYEPNGTNCIGCSIGYTSHIGQMCKRCSSNMYGERCRYECSCSRFEIREVRLACCGDSEARGIYCIACSKGYTSTIGQNCLPCTRKTYGERCKFECHCSDFEMFVLDLKKIVFVMSMYANIIKQTYTKQATESDPIDGFCWNPY
ncbi:unnamed protein product [Mytilus coruscus]|uniref:MEGF10_11 n=1 Tax=Mytilus coruscus TaxID=42192 RepID=A0A6J8EC44_MYTCO|nr:unnamed protein product [Mytilus coruscus]